MIFGFGNFDVVKGSGTGVTEERLAEVLTQEKANGTMDDIRVFDTRSAFPATGVSGVQYIDKDTEREYIWDGGEYKQTNALTTNEDIGGLFTTSN